MSRRRLQGFTLVELLIVITIISVLIGLTIPAVQSARARARQAECSNNQKQLALAFQQYETAKDHLPGYINRFGSVTHELSWPVVLLQYHGRNDLWEIWRDQSITFADKTNPASANFAGVKLGIMTCPSDTEAPDAGLNYVVNCGLDDGRPTAPAAPNAPDALANGVFHDQYNFSGNNSIEVPSDRIPDGPGQTLMFTENLQAGLWYSITEAEIGLVWAEYGPPGGPFPTRSPDPTPPWRRINEDRDFAGTDINHARPSSHHGGGVVVTYCDGRQDFVKEDIDYIVYARLMAPNDSRAPMP